MPRIFNVVRLWKALDYLRKHTSSELQLIFGVLLGLIAISVLVFKVTMNLSLVDAVYFVVTTVTTTGYGDITPRDGSTALKVFTCLVMILGSAAIATLYSIVTDFIITSRLLQLVGRHRIPESGHIVVAGLGNLGLRVIDELRRDHATVVGIGLTADQPSIVALRDQIPIVFGDAREQDTLERAGCEHATSIVAVTDDDGANLSLVLQAKALNSKIRSVVRIFDANFAAKVGEMDSVAVALSAWRISAPAFVAAALYKDEYASFLLRGHVFTLTPEGTPALANETVRLVSVKLSNGRMRRLQLHTRSLVEGHEIKSR